MRLEIQDAVLPPELVGLVDDRHFLADFDERVEHFDILGIETHATVTDTHADTVRRIRAVDEITRHVEFKDAMPERIIGARRHDGRQRVTHFRMFLPH